MCGQSWGEEDVSGMQVSEVLGHRDEEGLGAGYRYQEEEVQTIESISRR